eukprot:TRINITY_DN45421_c0_g1_i2.p1 TRINITY_DN45421_c0_g1~~TRINITY_DN45421_c0_g1_i2.p1  ORF type:complete len:183 (+),score=9.57 TRINITY_DN45421_c0_g1_i2:266-814(+)
MNVPEPKHRNTTTIHRIQKNARKCRRIGGEWGNELVLKFSGIVNPSDRTEASNIVQPWQPQHLVNPSSFGSSSVPASSAQSQAALRMDASGHLPPHAQLVASAELGNQQRLGLSWSVRLHSELACCWDSEDGVGRQLRSSSPSPSPLSLIHISEPTRLLSISYAVFCLKKKTIDLCHFSSPS